MISKKPKNLFYISIPLFVAHGVEEYFTGLYNFDPFYQLFSNPKIVFVFVVLILLNVLLIVSCILIQKNKWSLVLSTALGVLLVLELIHVYDAMRVGGYYPGLYTALVFPIIGFFFWKEFINNLRNSNN